MDFRLQSPYCSGFKVPIQQKGLIMQHLIVRKLTRRELEDKYLRLIDENYDLKRENNVQKEKIKVLTTKLLRLTKENSRYKSREFLFMDENNEIHEAEEFFRGRRPVSSSAIPRKSSDDNIRNSTPNLSKFKSEFSLQENMGGGSHGNRKSIEHSGVKNVDSNKMREMQEEIESLTEELRKLQEIGELEKQTNAQLEIQIIELKERLSGKKIQMELETSVEIAELNKKIKELQMELREVEVKYKKKIDENIADNEKLNEMLEKERNKVKRYEAQSQDLEASQKMIEELMQQISSLEKEKAELSTQYEKYATIADEVINYKRRMSEITTALDEREKELEKERADRASIEHSQEELLRKMKDLQKENDELVVKLEGLKTENDSLINKNKRLEDRIKILENENKQHLHQVNETLKLPTPIIREHDDLIATCSKEVKKIHEIHERVVQQKSLEMTSPENSQPSSLKSSRRLSSTPPNLAIPPVVIDDEKRPASSEKELKIIPKIIEPSTSVHVDQYTNTGNSNDFATIPPDSPNKQIFADTFSQSVSKDDGDDEFDPKTFSIDQVMNSNRKTYSLQQMETSIERAKDILLGDILGRDKTSRPSNMKRVRMSIDPKILSPIYSSYRPSTSSNFSQDASKISDMDDKSRSNDMNVKIRNDQERLEDYIMKNSSCRNSTISSSSFKSISQLEQFLSDHIDDEQILLKNSTQTLEIEIVKLEMCENSSLLEDDDVKFLYIEYTFLNHKGYLLETQSLPKPKKSGESTFYHLITKFDINPKDKEFKILKSMIEKNSKVPLKFLIVSEPIDSDEENAGNCEEIGATKRRSDATAEFIRELKIDRLRMTASTLKCEEKSRDFLLKANELKTQQKYSDAIIELNKSLCYATTDVQLGLVFALRAVIFFEIKRYGKCHEDLKLAKTHGYKGEILSIEKECIEKEKCENSDEDPWNFFKITIPTNKNLPFVAECLKLNETWKYGRCIVTDKPLRTGEIVIIEEPLFKMPNKDIRYKRCANCMKSNQLSLLPCTQQSCVSTMYCSKDCMKTAWKRFHRYECNQLEDSLENNEYDLMIQRIIFESIDICDGSVEKLKTLLEGVKSNQTIYDFNLNVDDEALRNRNRLKTIYALKKAASSEEDKLMADWFLDHKTLSALCKTNDQRKFLRTFILKMMGIIDRNSYLFYCLPSMKSTIDIEIGSGIFAFASLLNHSCSPNLYRFFVDNKQVYVVKKPIEAGQQLFVGYLSNFTLCDRDKRQINLLQDFQFKCTCEACVNNYPLMSGLKKYDENFVDPPTLVDDEDIFKVHKLYVSNCEYIENNIRKFNFPSYEICMIMQSSFRLLHYIANKYYLVD